MADPGSAESEQLDFKAKEVVETTEGKRDLARKAAAIANTKGGAIIVGIGEGDREDIIQSFDSRSEIKRDLANVFRDNTQPHLDQFTDINIKKLSVGARLLRIDIQSAERHPIEFNDRDSGEYVANHRVEDTTREMATTDIVEFADRRTQTESNNRSGLEEFFTVHTSDIHIHEDSDPRGFPDNRSILDINHHCLIVPAKAYLNNPYHKSLTFHLEKRAGGTGLSALEALLDEAEEKLDANLGFEFGYGIRYGTKEIIGRNSDNYVHDIRNLEETLQLLGLEDDTDPRPVAIGGTRCSFGLFWIQAQYHTGSLSRIKCGVMMSDLPLNTDTLNQVFGDKNVEQNNRLRSIELQLRGEEVPLANPREVLYDPSSSSALTEIVADNPYYRNEEAILASIDNDSPDPFISAICAVDRLPFDVRGGYSSDDVYHTLGEIGISYVPTVIPAYFVWPLCNPHVESPSEQPSTPDWLDPIMSDDTDGNSQ